MHFIIAQIQEAGGKLKLSHLKRTKHSASRYTTPLYIARPHPELWWKFSMSRYFYSKFIIITLYQQLALYISLSLSRSLLS